MTLLLRATPLLAIPTIALDTETTGLDVRKDRIIEFAAIPIENGALDESQNWQSLINHGGNIPSASTAIHGITDAQIKGAPGYAALAGQIEASLKEHLVIGHTIGFDLALLEEEHRRIGKIFHRPLALDVRLLAQIAAPDLPSYSLDALATWLGITSDGRHRAMSDARTAGLIFLALLPQLRDAGLRTLGETLLACKNINARGGTGSLPTRWSLDDANHAFIQPTEMSIGERLDSYPYRHIVTDVMSHSPFIMPQSTPMMQALQRMTQHRFSSVLVGENLEQSADVGILTERDIMRALNHNGASALAMPISAFTSRPLVTIPQSAKLYRAMGRMANRNLRHLVATNVAGTITGILTSRDLLKLRASAAIALEDDIENAPHVPALAKAWAKLPAMAAALMAEQVPARDIAAIIASEIAALTARAAAMAESELIEDGQGSPPCAYAVLVLGSAGRGESLLAMDQDNALIFEHGEPNGAEDRWFAKLGARMTAILDEVGVPLCKGGVMASQPEFRGAAALWRSRIAHWLQSSDPQDLLAVDIFFDFQAVYGAAHLAHQLWQDAWEAARHETAFLKLLAIEVDEGGAPLGFFGRIKTNEAGRVDLKRHGLKRLVTAARVLALKNGVLHHSTHERLAGVTAIASGGQDELARLDEDHALMITAILQQQIADINNNKQPNNAVSLKILTSIQQDALVKALSRQNGIADFLRAQISS